MFMYKNFQIDTCKIKDLGYLSCFRLAKVHLVFFQAKVSSPQKRKSSGQLVRSDVPLPPVVVVFEDLESFLPRVLQDFIAICR